MTHVEVANNVVYACGAGFSLGYERHDYIDIHDNIMYNSASTAYSAGVIFANSTPKKCRFANNTIIDDQATPVMTKAIELTGHLDFSDVEVRGNRFYVPNGTISSLFYREFGNEIIP